MENKLNNYEFGKEHLYFSFNSLITREGKHVDTSVDKWNLPYSSVRYSSINFEKISSLDIKISLKLFVKDRLERLSTHSGMSSFGDVWREVLRHWDTPGGSSNEEYLISLFEQAINKARKKHRLWAMYRPIQWYMWCAEFHSELGFSIPYAMELEAMKIPGNPKGEAVRLEDPMNGPLSRTLELPLLTNSLKNDVSSEFQALQEKAAVALMIAFGRNPANLTYLRESDLKKYLDHSESPCYVLSIPRIKKRQLHPREDFIDEYLEPNLGQIVEELIKANAQFPLSFNAEVITAPERRPLFINQTGNRSAIASNDIDNVHNMSSSDIGKLLSGFVKRHNLISPLTNQLMHVTPRRLRYTLATGLAAEGISKRELARILDHTDTQHVQVYFDMAGNIVEHLDKATAKGFSKYLNFFKGNVVVDDAAAVNGEREDKHLFFVDESDPTTLSDIGVCGESSVCHLDPPYSCYLCPKFQPYRHADHEHVLDCLLESRKERIDKYENSRLGIQLDEVIAAVAQVAEMCNKEVEHE